MKIEVLFKWELTCERQWPTMGWKHVFNRFAMPSAPNPRTCGTRAFTWDGSDKSLLFILSPPVQVDHCQKNVNNEKTPKCSALEGFSVLKAWQWPTLTWGDPTLPSALKRFTAEFGMGSGGSISLWSPSVNCHNMDSMKEVFLCFFCVLCCFVLFVTSALVILSLPVMPTSFSFTPCFPHAFGVIWSSLSSN